MRSVARLGAGVTALLLAAVAAPTTTVAATPSTEGDSAAVDRILIDAAQSPSWFPSATKVDRVVVGPTSGITVCMVGEDEVRVASDATTGYALVEYRAPATACMNLIERVHVFPTAADATRAWARIRVAAQKRCPAEGSVSSYSVPDGSGIGKVDYAQRVRTGERQYGYRSLEVVERSEWVNPGTGAVDRTGGGLTVWRLAGRTIIEVDATKVILGYRASAISTQERATVRALALLGAESAMQVTDPSAA